MLALLATGHSAPQAAVALGIAVRTVHKHLECCYRTLGVTNRTQASEVAWDAVGRPVEAHGPGGVP